MGVGLCPLLAVVPMPFLSQTHSHSKFLFDICTYNPFLLEFYCHISKFRKNLVTLYNTKV